MKQFVIYLLLASVVLSACGQQGINLPGNNQESTEANTAKKKISSRDYSINQSNAYSDVFLDSMALEQFIATKHISDSVARRMRSFDAGS